MGARYGEITKPRLLKRPHLYGLSYPRQPSPQVTLASRGNFLTYFFAKFN